MKNRFFFLLLTACMLITLFSFTCLTAATGSAIVYGDTNGDGIVSAKDLVHLKKYFAGYDYDTGESTVTLGNGADANGDGTVSAKDLVRLKLYFASYDYDTGTSGVPLGPDTSETEPPETEPTDPDGEGWTDFIPC